MILPLTETSVLTGDLFTSLRARVAAGGGLAMAAPFSIRCSGTSICAVFKTFVVLVITTVASFSFLNM